MRFAASRTVRKTPRRLTLITLSKSSIAMSSAMPREFMPALAITLSMEPNAFSARIETRDHRGFVLDVHGDGGCVPADLLDECLQPVGTARGDDDLCACGGRDLREMLPEPR